MNHQTARRAFWLSLILTLGALAALGLIDTFLKNTHAPLGIVSFELCAYKATCGDIVASWVGQAPAMAAMSLGLDYLFMVAYPAAICLGLWLNAQALQGLMRRVSLALAAGIWVAGAADAIENYHLFQMLVGQPVADHAWAGAMAASLKFAVLVPALLVWLMGLVAARRAPPPNQVKA